MYTSMDFVEQAKQGAAWLRDYITAIKNGRWHPFTALERKVREATRDEPWGPTGTMLNELAELSNNSDDCQIIFAVIEARLTCPPPKWRNVYKALTVLEFLITRGSEQCVELAERDLLRLLKSLQSFEFNAPDGKDLGINVRKRSELICILLEDKDRLRNERATFQAKKKQYGGYSASEMAGAGPPSEQAATSWTKDSDVVGTERSAPENGDRPGGRNAGEMKGVTLEENKRHLELLKAMLERPENRNCADCLGGGAGSRPTWASINTGVFICMKCAGVHRGLGVHISQVRSCTLDTWLPHQVEFMDCTGNKLANEYWEANLNETKPRNTDAMLETFIRRKYINKAFVSGDGTWPPPAKNNKPTPADTPATTSDVPRGPKMGTSSGPGAVSAPPVPTPVAVPLINLMDFGDEDSSNVAAAPVALPGGFTDNATRQQDAWDTAPVDKSWGIESQVSRGETNDSVSSTSIQDLLAGLPTPSSSSHGPSTDARFKPANKPSSLAPVIEYSGLSFEKVSSGGPSVAAPARLPTVDSSASSVGTNLFSSNFSLPQAPSASTDTWGQTSLQAAPRPAVPALTAVTTDPWGPAAVVPPHVPPQQTMGADPWATNNSFSTTVSTHSNHGAASITPTASATGFGNQNLAPVGVANHSFGALKSSNTSGSSSAANHSLGAPTALAWTNGSVASGAVRNGSTGSLVSAHGMGDYVPGLSVMQAPVQASDSKKTILDELQWKGLEEFTLNATKNTQEAQMVQPPKPAPLKPAGISLREQKMMAAVNGQETAAVNISVAAQYTTHGASGGGW